MRKINSKNFSVMICTLFVLVFFTNCKSYNIYRAARFNNLEELEGAFSSGVNINIPNKNNYSALMIAIQKQNINTVLFLLERGADPNYSPPNSITPFRFAISIGNEEIVYYCMEYNADLNKKNVDQWTPLMTAAYYGQLEVAKMLVNAGADVSVKTKSGYTALWLAKKNGNKELIDYFSKTTKFTGERAKKLEVLSNN